MADPLEDRKADSKGLDASFEKLLNFRDVGKTINSLLGQKHLKEGKIFRSARLDNATLSDRNKLRDEYGIKTILDLRTKTEHINEIKKREADLNDPAQVGSNKTLSEPLQIPGIDYIDINVNGKGFERSLLWQLSYWNTVKLISLMAFGYRMEAISILGRNVMNPVGLLGLGYLTLETSGPELAQALRSYSSSTNYPILVHCTQGKDRTGLIIALVLFILGIPLKAISSDYLMTERELVSERESRLVEIRQIGLSDDFASCPQDFVEKMYEYLEAKHGGVDGYLMSIGFTDDDKNNLISALRA